MATEVGHGGLEQPRGMGHVRSCLGHSGDGPNGLVYGGTWNVYPQTLCLGEYWPFAALENRSRGGLYRSALQDLLQDRKDNDESQFEASAVASGKAWLPECLSTEQLYVRDLRRRGLGFPV